MKKILLSAVLVFCVVVASTPVEAAGDRVRIETEFGAIVIELDAKAAPKTVENFLQYVNEGYYDGLIFHRVIRGFMIQGGGLTPDMAEKPTRPPIVNEADNGLKNRRGTIAMARTSRPHSATAQFFINTVDNPFLDHRKKTTKGWGYCVFGRVISGMEAVDAIEKQRTTTRRGHRDVPSTPVVIRHARAIDGSAAN